MEGIELSSKEFPESTSLKAHIIVSNESGSVSQAHASSPLRLTLKVTARILLLTKIKTGEEKS